MTAFGWREKAVRDNASSVRNRAANGGVRGLIWRNVAALVAFVVAFSVVSDMGQVGARYFYCDAFGLLRHDPCGALEAANGDSAGPNGEARQEHTDCCQVLAVAPLPNGTMSGTSHVPPPLLVAILPASPLLAPQGATTQTGASTLERWRPPPHSAGRRCAELMVFRT